MTARDIGPFVQAAGTLVLVGVLCVQGCIAFGALPQTLLAPATAMIAVGLGMNMGGRRLADGPPKG